MYNVWARLHLSMGRVVREYFVQEVMADDLEVERADDDLELIDTYAQRVTAEVVADMLTEEEGEW